MRFQLWSILLLAILFTQNSFAINSPDVSANAVFLYRNSNFHKEDSNPLAPDPQPNGLDLQEAELQFFSAVDPYTRLSLLLTVAPEYTSDGVTVSQEWGIEPEEAFAESNVIDGVTLKVGKFKAAMNKHNTLHTHAFPLINSPLAESKLLGDEGLNDIGASASILLPTGWFSELTLQYLKGKGENAEFNSPSPSEGVGLVHWKNLTDLSDDLTLEIGASYAQGANSFKEKTYLTGGDLTFKWRPAEGGKYTSLVWATEYLSRQQSQLNVPDEMSHGLASWIQYQFKERWVIHFRYDNLVIEDTFDPINLPNDTWERNSIG